jgi:hypothetical protein
MRPGDRDRRQVAEYVQARLRREAEEEKHGYQAKIARYAKCAPAHVSNVIKGSRKAGESFITAMAAYWGCSSEEMKQRAAHWKLNGWSTEVPLIPRFPNREAAVTTFGHQFLSESIAKLREISTRSGQDMPSAWWLKHLELVEEDLRAEHDASVAARRKAKDEVDTDQVKGALRNPKKAKAAKPTPDTAPPKKK